MSFRVKAVKVVETVDIKAVEVVDSKVSRLVL
jgi:hypothetical protein